MRFSLISRHTTPLLSNCLFHATASPLLPAAQKKICVASFRPAYWSFVTLHLNALHSWVFGKPIILLGYSYVIHVIYLSNTNTHSKYRVK